MLITPRGPSPDTDQFNALTISFVLHGKGMFASHAPA
jgi:hypothetical protein